MIDKSSLLKSQGSLYLEFIHKDGLFQKCFYCRLWDFKLVYVTLNLAFVQRLPRLLFCGVFWSILGSVVINFNYGIVFIIFIPFRLYKSFSCLNQHAEKPDDLLILNNAKP